MQFLKIVREFIKALFFGATPEYKKSHELRKIQQQLRTITPAMFKNGQILPQFAMSMLSFWQFSAPIRDVLIATIGNDDRRTALKYQDFVIESGLTVDRREYRASLLYDARRLAVISGQNPDLILIDMETEFTRFLRIFDQPEFVEMDRQLQRLYTILDVCKYNFADFFLFFDASFALGSDSAAPKFMPVPPVQLVNELSDFYFVIHRFSIDDRLAELIIQLRERLEKSSFDDIARQKLIKTYRNADSFQKANLPVSVLTSLLKLAREDPNFVPQKDDTHISRLQDYKLRLSDQYSTDTERIRRELQENTILLSIKELFPDMELLPIKGYNESVDTLLQKNTTSSFRWVKPLKIIRTFYSLFFDTQLNTVVNAVLTEGFFADKKFEQQISTGFYFCSNAEPRFISFEEDFEPNKTFDELTLREFIENLPTDVDTYSKKIKKIVDDANYYAQTFVQTEITRFEQFTASLQDLISDSKRTTPELVGNIRTVVMGKSFDFLTLLEKKIGYSSRFLEIMKNFAVVRYS